MEKSGKSRKTITSLYIHYPFCRHLCNYCDFYKSVPSEGDQKAFHSLIDKMWKTHKNFLAENNVSFGPLKSLYIGGGTPSLWGDEGIEFLKSRMKEWSLELSEDIEFTLEVNPGTWSEESISNWKKLGVNRFSLGIQSLRNDYLKVLDRVHNVSDVFKTLKFFNEIDANFSVDFMLGLPWSQTKERKILEELEEILSFNPSHLSLYILTAKAGYPFKKELPEDDFLSEEYMRVVEYLEKHGYYHYEVSNFSKKGSESVHNIQYWKSNPVAALGPSAVGYLSEQGKRYKWKVKSAEFVLEELSEESQKLENLYMGLRLREGVDLGDHFSKVELNKLTPLFNKWKKEGLAEFSGPRLSLKSEGLLILDGLMQQIFSQENT